MAQGSKINYSAKQKRQAKDIETHYEEKGVTEKEATKRAWATVNKMWGGAEKIATKSKKPTRTTPAQKDEKKATRTTAKKTTAQKNASAKKAVLTRAKNKTINATSK